MKNYEFESFADVLIFIEKIYYLSKCPFDPANDLRTIVKYDGSLLFDKVDGPFYENKMNECFIYCLFNKIDIYRVVESVVFKNQQLLAA